MNLVTRHTSLVTSLALAAASAGADFPRFPVIVPSLEDHAEELAADGARLVRETVVDGAALNASLQPCGNPPDDRAAGYVRLFRQLREAIEHETLPIYGFQFHPEYYWEEHAEFLELVKAALAEGKEIANHEDL